jgi:hypothetical protein
VTGLIPQDPLNGREGLLKSPGKKVAASNTKTDGKRERLESVSMKDSLQGLLVASHGREERRIPSLGVSIFRLQLQGAPELLLCGSPVPVEQEVNHPKPGMSFRQQGLQLQ